MVKTGIERSLPSHETRIATAFKQVITNGTEMFLVGNRIVEALPGVSIVELKPQAQAKLDTPYPLFAQQSELGRLFQALQQYPLSGLSTVRRQDTDFMIRGDLSNMLEALHSQGLEDQATMHASLHDPTFQLIEIADPLDNPDGVVTIFASGHPNSYRESSGSNIDLNSVQLGIVDNEIELVPNEQTNTLIGEPPTLKLINTDNLDPTSPLAADITMRFFRHSTTIRVNGQPIDIQITPSQQDFLLRTLIHQYQIYFETEDPSTFRRLYELELCKLALQDQAIFSFTHLANAILYQAWIHILQGSKAQDLHHIHFNHNYLLQLMEMS